VVDGQQDELGEHPERGQTSGLKAALAGMQHRKRKRFFRHFGSTLIHYYFRDDSNQKYTMF
jgi:hypothetical protein